MQLLMEITTQHLFPSRSASIFWARSCIDSQALCKVSSTSQRLSM